MRIYRDLPEALNEARRDVVEMGHLVRPSSYQDQIVSGNKDFETLEVQNYVYSVSMPRSGDIYPLTSQPWADKEFRERIGSFPLNPGTAWQARQKIWEPFLHNGKFSYTYSERLATQLPRAIEQLKKDPDSRQIFIGIWDPKLDAPRIGGLSRIPCTLGYQVQIRDKKLNLTYLQRSCDSATHFANDVYLANRLQEYLAEEIGVQKGYYVHWIGSLHIFRKDTEGVF